MPATATPIINGFAPEWADLQMSALGQIFLGIKSIDYSTDSDGADVYGTFPEAIARTVGFSRHQASVELYLPDAAVFLAALGDDYRRIPIDISVSFSGPDSVVLTDILSGCLIKTVSNSHSQGSDALTRKFDLRPFRIKRSTSAGAFVLPVVTDIIDPFA